MLRTTDHDLPGASSRGAFRSFRKAAAGLVALGLVGLGGHAAVAKPIKISQTLGLSFGRLATTPTQGGTATINPSSNQLTVTGGVVKLSSGTPSRAQLLVTGTADAAFFIQLPSSTNLNDGTNWITADTFTSSPSGSDVLDGSGERILYVGATLNLSANQPANTYTGSFIVYVFYE